MRDGSGAWGGAPEGESKTRFTPSNICDFIAINHHKNETLFLELKSTKSKSLPLSNIKSSQLLGLYNASKYKGVKAYLVINFRKYDRTFMLDVLKVNEFTENEARKSIPITFCEEHGVEIEQKKKVSRYEYNIMPYLLGTEE